MLFVLTNAYEIQTTFVENVLRVQLLGVVGGGGDKLLSCQTADIYKGIYCM